MKSKLRSVKVIITACLFSASLTIKSQVTPSSSINIPLAPGEKVWAGIIVDGVKMPLKQGYIKDFYGNNYGNQTQPLLLTDKGQYVWSEEPYKFEVQNDKIIISQSYGKIEKGKEGNTLAEAQRFVSRKFFPASGKMPDTLLFSRPQYNTWIELTYNQNQEDVLKYARSIIANGLPAGVLMIDDTWQEDYGLWNFHPGRFRDPKKMMDELHSLGFKVMLWVCPFVSADQAQIYRELKKNKGFLLNKKNAASTWENSNEPIMIDWWNGISAELDLSSPAGVKWFNDQLNRLVKDYGVDGFKFDAGDFYFYPPNSLSRLSITPNEHSRLFAEIGLRYPLNEYRACWKMGGQPLAQRLRDKEHSWKDLQTLVPNMLVENLMGYTFSCPDLIGGGEYTSFTDDAKIDQELIVRSAQCHTLMTMMQFSVAPWRILDKEHLDAVKKSVDLRMKFTPLIMKLAKQSANTGEPIMMSMEYVFPGKGYSEIKDQFMLGNEMIVAPMLEKGISQRIVVLPEGKWKADDGTTFKGGKSYTIDVPLDRLPYFVSIK
jgi:alpha-glucosidase (family GH31 glycosyl hydrolase)